MYGQIAGSKNVNTLIYMCFDYLCEEDKQKFLKYFREQPPASKQIIHTFRELILGAYLRYHGHNARYDYSIKGRKPDWCIIQEPTMVNGIIELANFHIDLELDDKIDKYIQKTGLVFYWRDGIKDNVIRLYNSILNKILKYRNLVEELQTPYVVAIFCDFRVPIDLEEIQFCLFDEKDGLFHLFIDLSGLLYFTEDGGRFFFHFFPNPNSIRELTLSNGEFPFNNV